MKKRNKSGQFSKVQYIDMSDHRDKMFIWSMAIIGFISVIFGEAFQSLSVLIK